MGSSWSQQSQSDYDSDDDVLDSEEETYELKNSAVNLIREELNSAIQQLDECDSICLDSATDAAVAASPATMTLTITDVLNIEDQLDLYEKVSLIYLIFDNPNFALLELNKLRTNSSEKPLYNWAIHQNLTSTRWQEKFIEAICIIQNYQVLKNLGMDRDELDARFLPHQIFGFEAVNKVRKALYFVCETLTQSEVEILLAKARKDFDLKGLEFKTFDSLYLEMYLLHWEVLGYVKPNDLSNLCYLLKQLEFFDLVDDLKQVVPNTVNKAQKQEQVLSKNKTVDKASSKQKKQSSIIFDKILDETSLLDVISMESHVSADNAVYVNASNKYQIDCNNPGTCLIINQEDFYKEVDPKFKHLLAPPDNKFETRFGSQKDKHDLEATFKLFGFKTQVVDNLTHTEVIETVEEVVRNITTDSCLFICIMSHGDKGVVYGVNSCKVSVARIEKIMCTRNRLNLSGKPKVLILQSCQGTECQQISLADDEDIAIDGPSSAQEIVPPVADLFTFWATVPGFSAIRHKTSGSWFIQSLCEKLRELGNKYHFEDICTQVIHDVSNKIYRQKGREVAMVPKKDSSLRKLLYLPPMKNQ